MKILKKVLSVLLRIGISIILLFFLFKFKNINIQDLFQSIKNTDKLLLSLAFVVFSFIYVLCFFRWQMLIRAVQIKLPIKRVIVAFAGGIFFNQLMPSTIGGDLARSIDLSVHTGRTKDIVATVFLDRLSGYIGLVIVALVSLFFGWALIRNDRAVIFSIATITGLLIAVLFVLFNGFIFSKVEKLLYSPKAGKIRETLKNVQGEIYHFKKHKKVILGNLLLSIIIQAINPISCYIIALSLGAKVDIIYFFIFLPIIGAITLLPISIGGLGLRENAMVLFFGKVGMSQKLATSIALLNFFFILVYVVIGGLIYVLTVHHRRIQHNKPPTLCQSP